MQFLREGKTLAIFSHPNHETAIFATLRRIKPTILYLTDGGGKERVNQTKRGLDVLGVREKALFLDYTEPSFYEAILQQNMPYFRGLVAHIAETISKIKPDQILVDAVEYYNPIHDMSLPLLWANWPLKPASPIPLFEVPLVHQDQKTGQMVIQRASEGRRSVEIRTELTEQEVRMKVTAWNEVYTLLADQMGPTVRDPGKTGAAETLLPAERPLLPRGCAMRYEGRGKLHLKEGKVTEVITYADHWEPIVKEFLGDAA